MLKTIHFMANKVPPTPHLGPTPIYPLDTIHPLVPTHNFYSFTSQRPIYSLELHESTRCHITPTPHTPLTEFHVQLMVTFPFAGSPSLIEFHMKGKKHTSLCTTFNFCFLMQSRDSMH